MYWYTYVIILNYSLAVIYIYCVGCQFSSERRANVAGTEVYGGRFDISCKQLIDLLQNIVFMWLCMMFLTDSGTARHSMKMIDETLLWSDVGLEVWLHPFILLLLLPLLWLVIRRRLTTANRLCVNTYFWACRNFSHIYTVSHNYRTPSIKWQNFVTSGPIFNFLGRLPKVDLIILEGKKSVHPYVRPSTKSFSDLNEIWYVGRGRWVMHDGMPYGRIQGQGQGHEPFKVWIPSIFKTYLLRHLPWELASDH